MKKFLILILATLSITVFTTSCQKSGDHDLDGQTFVYWNGYTGSMKIRRTYEFQRNGNVYYTSEVGTSSPFTTNGCSLYYTLDNKDLTIYHGTRGWKKEVWNTVFETGVYYGNYIMIDGDKFERR